MNRAIESVQIRHLDPTGATEANRHGIRAAVAEGGIRGLDAVGGVAEALRALLAWAQVPVSNVELAVLIDGILACEAGIGEQVGEQVRPDVVAGLLERFRAHRALGVVERGGVFRRPGWIVRFGHAREDAGHQVGPAARRIGNDQLYRPLGVAVRLLRGGLDRLGVVARKFRGVHFSCSTALRATRDA